MKKYVRLDLYTGGEVMVRRSSITSIYYTPRGTQVMNRYDEPIEAESRLTTFPTQAPVVEPAKYMVSTNGIFYRVKRSTYNAIKEYLESLEEAEAVGTIDVSSTDNMDRFDLTHTVASRG